MFFLPYAFIILLLLLIILTLYFNTNKFNVSSFISKHMHFYFKKALCYVFIFIINNKNNNNNIIVLLLYYICFTFDESKIKWNYNHTKLHNFNLAHTTKTIFFIEIVY